MVKINYFEESLKLHEKLTGKISLKSKVAVETREDLSLAYTPGVAEPCRRINKNIDDVYKYTSKGNLVAVVTDGTAVLGLGDIGPEAGMPVMEGKAVLFKEFGGVDAFPICLGTKDVDEIVKTVKLISPGFGGINLEDISAPRCFEIERRLKEELDIPVFHDDQHGTAIVVLAGILNSMKITGQKLSDMKVVINGAGAAGTAIAYLLQEAGAANVILCDRTGALCVGREKMNDAKNEVASKTNPNNEKGSLADVLKNANIFIGVSSADAVSQDMVRSMAKDPIIMAMANPNPEIMPDLALEAGARIMATGRSDFPNQINNVLAFPGIFKGAFEVRASDINEEMKIAAAHAIANLVAEDELEPDYIIPAAFDERVAPAVAEAVKQAAIDTGVNRI